MTSNGAHLAMATPTSPSAPDISVVQTTTGNEIVIIKGRRYRQRQLGPAPFASFEDLSDELDSPPETARITLPGIKEDPSSQIQSPSTPLPEVTTVIHAEKEDQNVKDALKNSLVASGPPRIDISRASSSSQHEDSITSSPDRENDAHNLGYKEDGTIELRSSTEELYYTEEKGTVEESEEKRKREKILKRQQQVKDSGDLQILQETAERKDSSCSVMSEVGLLCISGRTSRLSSVGSAASGGSAISGTSHLSVSSQLSGRSSRSPSPHKMLLETSFCGSKPMHSVNVESEASSSLSTLEKLAAKPTSSLRSRSPSPHKMLLETSFCGTKTSPLDIQKSEDIQNKGLKKKKPSASSISKITAEIETVSTEEIKPQLQEGSKKSPQMRMKSVEKPKVDRLNEVKIYDKVSTTSNMPKSSKVFLKPEKKASKPKKIISLRDLPVDEIYIPLKGPEVDFEEIIRNVSPHVKKKVIKSSIPSADEIFIPLVSPTKTIESQKYNETFAARSPSAPSKSIVSQNVFAEAKRVPDKEKPSMKEYEICEDGSIFIPLNSPEEDKRVNQVKNDVEEFERDYKKEEQQCKPGTLNLIDSASSSTRCQSSILPADRSEMAFGGSKTPSPGFSLSRKSSFVNLFRKSDVSGSPDSQSGGGGSGKKKSATSSIASRETIEGAQERSHFRSKSKERCSGSSTSSGKKSVFTNLFGKKKTETKSVTGRESEKPNPTLPKLDLQFVFGSGTESSRKAVDEDMENEIETLNLGEETVVYQKPFRSVDENSNAEKSEKIESNGSGTIVPTGMTESLAIKGMIGNAKVDKEEQKQLTSKETTSKQPQIMCSEPLFQIQKLESSLSVQKEPQRLSQNAEEVSLESASFVENVEVFVHEESSDKFAEENLAPTSLEKESILNAEEERTVKEEAMTVTADGIRKLQLPPEPGDLDDDHERKGLVHQESFEDELPYIPTTLPLERSLGVPIIPVKQRVSEIKTCPIERPRSTTPINPTTLEDFVSSKETTSISEEEKMKISLPRDDSVTSKSKSPRKHSAKGKSWFEFAEEGLQSPRDHRKSSLKTSPSPPPLPPRSPPLTASVPSTTSSRINFEALPEKKKLPKRIVTVPALRNSEDFRNSPQHRTGSPNLGNVVYNYVSPEECQCECHDHNVSHHIKSDSKKGTRNVLSSSPRQVNSEFINILPRKNSVNNVMIPKISEISGCEYCDVAKELSENEDNVEGRPLLEENSDEETESEAEFPPEERHCRFGKKNEPVLENEAGSAVLKQDDWKNLKWDEKTKQEKLSPSSSGSSSERISSSEFPTALCNDPPNAQDSKIISKPFEMDLQVNSNDSSLLSQEDLISPSDSTNSTGH